MGRLGIAAARRRGVSVPTDRGKRGQDTKVSYPLLRLPNFPLSRDSLRSRG